MTFSGKIRIFVAVLLICILPYGAFSQNTEKARKGFWNKKERVEKTVTEEENAKEKKLLGIFNRKQENQVPEEEKIKERKLLGIFKSKGEKDEVAVAEVKDGKFWDKFIFWRKDNVVDSTHTKEYRAALRQEKKENSHKTQYSVGTNLLNWAYFGTANLEASASLGNHFSAFAGGKYNSWNFETKAFKEVYNKQITGYAGVKWWPWFVNTGWWVGAKAQYSDFSTAGIMSSYQRDGVAVGAGLSGGYTFMMGRHFNLDLGIGVWGGTYLKYSDYEKPGEKPNMFVKLDNIIVSFTYFF